MMKPIPTKERLPPCADDGEDEVWWWDADNDGWMLGIPLLMDLENELHRWTHWLPLEAIVVPE